MYHPYTTPARFVPSEDEVTLNQARDPEAVCSVKVEPESDDVNMYPLNGAAANFVPSDEEATSFHPLAPAEVSSVQVEPESADLYM